MFSSTVIFKVELLSITTTSDNPEFLAADSTAQACLGFKVGLPEVSKKNILSMGFFVSSGLYGVKIIESSFKPIATKNFK